MVMQKLVKKKILPILIFLIVQKMSEYFLKLYNNITFAGI